MFDRVGTQKLWNRGCATRIPWSSRYTKNAELRVLPPFHSTCPGEFFLRVLIRCLFSHFSVLSSILCTSWRGQRILFRSFFAVSKCFLHRLRHNKCLPLFLSKSEPACLQQLRQYRTHMRHANYGRYGSTSKNRSPFANIGLTKVR